MKVLSKKREEVMTKKSIKGVFLLLVSVFASFAIAADWYEGGTLHNANGIEWQQATHANKLATAGDLVATVYRSGKLAPVLSGQIKAVDDIKVMAAALVKELDRTFAPELDPAKNKAMFTNQKVNEMAVILMAAAGWLSN